MHGFLARTATITLRILVGLVLLALVLGLVAFLVIRGLVLAPSDEFGTVDDEAKRAGLTVADLPAAGDAYFAAMDKALLVEPGPNQPYPPEIQEVAAATGLSEEEVRTRAIKGQNMWIVWTGGNDRFWDFAARTAIGSFDLLKIMSSHESQAYGRDNRFRYLGLVNEPCFTKPTAGDPKHFGLWIDQRDPDCAPDPFADPAVYPGVKVGARGAPVTDKWPESTEAGGVLPVGSYYGEPTGVMGLRLFPNPDFDAEAAADWDPERYYTDEAYYNRADLVRPYRVGMSCAFCHVGPNPIDPPAQVEAPRWSEMTSNPGAQYFWVDRIFFWNTKPRTEPGAPSPNEGNFLYQLFHTNPPGSLDTSLVSTDYMNNPRTMNAVYETGARLGIAARTGRETLKGGELDNRQFQDFEASKALSGLFDPSTGTVASMRVLKDGADSVGTLGALNRVYLNIGLFSEEWLLHFRPFLGGQKISPIKIADAQRNSVYWQATEAQSVDMAIFFLVAGRADRLADAPGGQDMLDAQAPDMVDHGATVFAETCAACHSSKQPEPDPAFGVDQGPCAGGGAGPGYRACWDRYWAWAQSDAFKGRMVEMVKAPGFLEGNYLSTERRVPLDLIRTNACGAIATNGLDGDIWDNFTSSTYKSLPPPGEVTVHDPVSGGARGFQSPGNGRGYLRPASLVSLWSTAPYLLNNSVGHEPRYYQPGYHEDEQAYRPTARGGGPETPTAADYVGETPGLAAPAPAGAPAGTGEAPAGTSYPADAPEGAGDAADPAAAAGAGYQIAATYPPAYGPASCPAADPGDPYLPCVENRVAAFQSSIRQMLSPELRPRDDRTTEPVPGVIYRTTAPSCLMVPPGYTPAAIKRWTWLLSRVAPWAVTPEGGVEIGPFPEGFPINALVNTELLPDNDEGGMMAHGLRMAAAGPTLIKAFSQLGGQCSPEELADPGVRQHAERVVKDTGLIDALVGLSKCPDYVVNRGHEFGSGLSPADKEALIAYLLRL